MPRNYFNSSQNGLIAATRAAIARARRRGGSEVSPDDLLIGLLKGMARFGLAIVGTWAIDLAGLGEDWLEERPRAEKRGPAYSPEAAAMFDQAAAVARKEGAPRVEPIHLLAAFAPVETGLMGRLKETYGITETGWREALARSRPGGWNGADGSGEHDAGGRGGPASGRRELLSPDEAAEFLGVHTQTVRGYIRTGKLPAYRIGGERFIRIRHDDLLALLEPLSPEDAGLPGREAAG